MGPPRLLSIAGWIIAGWLASTSGTPLADPQPAPSIYTWRVNAQPLGQALTQVARQLDTSIWFDPVALQGLSAPALEGEMTAPQVLDQLLTGSGFQAVLRSSGWLIERRPEPLTPAPQPAPRRPIPTPALEQLLVIGSYSRNQQTAIHQKRASNRFQDGIIAEDIAQFPAHNIAEALQRSPGISVVRDRGEALFISIRGLPTPFNRLSLNGHLLAVNENVRNSEQHGRRFHYDTFPAELVAGVEVRKSTTASDEEGAIGGSVDIRPFNPLALENTRLSLSASANSTELVGDWRPKLAALGNWVNSERSLGVSLAAAYNQRHLRQDRALNFRWQQLPLKQMSAQHDYPALLTPAGVRPTLELEQRERLGLSSSLQWRPNETWQLDVHWLQLQQQIDYQEYSYSADYNSEGLLGDAIQTCGNALVAGSTDTGSVQIGHESAGLEDQNQLLDITLGWQGDDWQLSGSWVNSRARSGNPEAIKRTRLRRQGDASFHFDYSGGLQLPQIDYLNIDLLNASDFPGRRLEWRSTSSEDEGQTLKLGAIRDLYQPPFQQLEHGLHWRRQQRDYWRKDRLVTQGISGVVFPDDYFVTLPVDDFLGNRGQMPHRWLVPRAGIFWQGVDRRFTKRRPAPAIGKIATTLMKPATPLT